MAFWLSNTGCICHWCEERPFFGVRLVRRPEPHLHHPVKVVHGASKLLAVLAVERPPMRHGPEHPAQLDAVGPPECPSNHVAC